MFYLPGETLIMEPLHELVNRLTTSFLPKAAQDYNFFINDIPTDLYIEHNQEWVASVINGMISTAVSCTKGACIRFSAKKYGYILVLEIHEAGRSNNYPENTELEQIQQIAEQIGGCLLVNTQNQQRTIMSFSFPNLPVAA